MAAIVGATGAVADGAPQDAGLIEIKGTFVEGGVECPLFRTEDSETYALEGIDRSLVQIGQQAALKGQFVMFSTCQQGQTFSVKSVEPVGTP